MRIRLPGTVILIMIMIMSMHCSKKVVQIQPPPPKVEEAPPASSISRDDTEDEDRAPFRKKREVEDADGSKSAPLKEDAEVAGYLDNPIPAVILDKTGKAGAGKSARESDKSHSMKRLRRGGGGEHQVKAATHDDNEEIISYREFCRDRGDGISPYFWDISTRYILKVIQKDGTSAWNRNVSIIDKKGKECFTATTPASGEIVLLPKMDLSLPYNGIEKYSVIVDGTTLPLERSQDDYLRVPVESTATLPTRPPLQICFLMDATGSMGDEIAQLQDVIFSIHSRILALPAHPNVEFTIVAYRDRKDAYLVNGRQFTANIDSFQLALEKVKAGGGGDYPEDVEAGLMWCMDSLAWRDSSLKFIFLVADAPPHMNKKQDNYLHTARRCREQGIMICPVGASGLDLSGEYVFRQMAMLTRGQFVFLHYGEKGESDGKATSSDPGKVSHHTGSNYNARRLDDIVVDIVSTELSFLTPETKIVRTYPQPEQQSELLDIRMTNLLRQVVDVPASLTEKSIVLSPVSFSDSSLHQLSDYLWTSALEKLPKYTDASVIEREKMQEILKEQAISLSGLTEEKGIIDMGKMLNADYMILSKLLFLGSLRLCHMRMVDCTTGRIVSAARVRL